MNISTDTRHPHCLKMLQALASGLLVAAITLPAAAQSEQARALIEKFNLRELLDEVQPLARAPVEQV